jgi:drug/metabolite transporter (DMT)-like permease
MPVFGSVMAFFFLGESFRWFHWAGMVLIAAGIVTTLRAAK